jgi:tetratricopeptide (TPR) repeat protein
MLKEILDKTAERVGKEMAAQPDVDAELRILIGRLYREIGKYDKAVQMHRTALRIDEGLFGSESPEAAAALNELGLSLWKDGKLVDAEEKHRKALAIWRRRFGMENTNVAASTKNLSDVLGSSSKLAEAEALGREALAIRRKLLGNEHLEVSDSLSGLVVILGYEGKLPEAEAVARDNLAMLRKLGAERKHPLLLAAALRDLSTAIRAIGDAKSRDPASTEEAKRKWEEAESLGKQALALQRSLLGDENPELAASLSLLALAMGRREAAGFDVNDSTVLLGAALSMQRKQLGEDNPAFIDSLGTLAWLLESKQQFDQAEAVLHQVLTKQRQRAGSGANQSRETLEHLIRILLKEKKFEDAEHLLRETLSPSFVKQRACLGFLELRTDLMARLGRWPEAKADSALALELDPDNQDRSHRLAPLLAMTGDRFAYEKLCQRSLATYADTADPFAADRVAKDCLLLPSPELDLRVTDRLADTAVTVGKDGSRYSEYHRLSMPYFQLCKALSEYRQGHFAPAVEWAQKSLQDAHNNSQAQAYPVLAMAQWRLGEKDLARAALAEADASVARISPGRNNEEGVWLGWIFAKIWLDEAMALIDSGPASEPGKK